MNHVLDATVGSRRPWMRAMLMLTVLVVLSGIPGTAGAADGDEDVTVTALHAIPGQDDFPADVYIDGSLAISGFTKMTRSDPFTVPPGSLIITIFENGADPDTDVPVLDESLDLAAGDNLAVVAQLDSSGSPILAVYANDILAVPAGQARFVFRQTSSMGAVDVLADGEPLFENVAGLEEATLEIPAGPVELQIVASAGDEVLASADVDVREGELTAVYAVDTTAGDGLDLAVQVVSGLGAQPSGVPTGSGGLAATSGGIGATGVLLSGLAVAGIALMFFGMRRRAPQAPPTR